MKIPVLALLLITLIIATAAPAAAPHGDLATKIKALSRTIAAHPDDATLRLRRGELHRLHKDWKAAEADYHEALRLDPALNAIQLARACMHHDSGDLQAAEMQARLFLDLEPGKGQGWIVLAQVLARQNRHLEAARAYEQAIPRLRNPRPEHYLQRARLLIRAGSNHGAAAIVCLDEGLQRLTGARSLDIEALRYERALGLNEAAQTRIERMRQLPRHTRPSRTPSRTPVAAAGPTPVVVRGPYLQTGTETGVIVRWRTDIASDSRVSFGAAPGALLTTAVDATLTTEHEVAVTGLTAETTYFYSIGTTSTVLAGDDPDHFFKTAPPFGSQRPMRFWVLGDSGTKNNFARNVRDAYYDITGPVHTDAWLMLGDNAYNTGTDQEYQLAVFQNMYESMLQKSVLWPALGNHDAISSDSGLQTGPYFDIFTLPIAAEAGGVPSGTESYYSFDWGNVHFVCLDSAWGLLPATGAMALWLQADLASTTQDWVIAYWHHPPYSKGSHDSDTEYRLAAMRANFLPILDSFGADLILGGHSHSYERSMLLDGHYGHSAAFNPATMALDTGDGNQDGNGAYRKLTLGSQPHEGAVYVVGGSSGGATNAPLNHPVMISGHVKLGSIALDVNGLQLDVRFIGDDRRTTDHFTLVKGGVSPIPYVHTPIPPLDIWRYDDTGTNLGSAWRTPGFNDSGWSMGKAILGFGESYINGQMSFGGNPANVHATTYFRKVFSVAAQPTHIDNLRLNINYDDGFVAFINGTTVASRSLPTSPVNYNTLATSHEGGFYESIDITPFKGLLTPGLNTLAVEVHQTSATSSDLVFDASLNYDAFVPALESCAAGSLPDDVLRINGSTGGFGRSVDVKTGAPLTIEVLQPASWPGNANFALFGMFGTPAPADVFHFSPSIGSLCFTPGLLVPTNPLLFTLASSIPAAPGAVPPASPLPWNLPLPLGVAQVGLTLTFQPVLMQSPSVLKVGNAVRLEIVP